MSISFRKEFMTTILYGGEESERSRFYRTATMHNIRAAGFFTRGSKLLDLLWDFIENEDAKEALMRMQFNSEPSEKQNMYMAVADACHAENFYLNMACVKDLVIESLDEEDRAWLKNELALIDE